MIKAITFDLGNTLLRHDNLEWEKLERAGFANHARIFTKLGLRRPTQKQWSEAYYRYFNELRVIGNKHHLEVSVERIFTCLHSEFGLPPSITVPSLLHSFFMPVVVARQLVDGADKVVNRLKERGYKLAVISNTITPGMFGRDALQRLGILDVFDFTLYSSDCLYCKPHSTMFEMALHRWKIHSSSVIHIGDQLHRDVYGAARAGLRTLWLNPTGAKIRHKRFKPDYELAHLHGLPDLLESV